METGIVYPKITLGGVEYELKFSRGSLFRRMGNAGVANLGDLMGGNLIGFAKMIDTLHAILGDQYRGSADDLADMVLTEDKGRDVAQALFVALGKVFPSRQVAQTAAGDPAAPRPN